LENIYEDIELFFGLSWFDFYINLQLNILSTLDYNSFELILENIIERLNSFMLSNIFYLL